MKKLLTILTTVSLLTPTMDTIVSCNSKPKFIPDDDDDDSTQTTKDVEIMNNIKNKSIRTVQSILKSKSNNWY